MLSIQEHSSYLKKLAIASLLVSSIGSQVAIAMNSDTEPAAEENETTGLDLKNISSLGSYRYIPIRFDEFLSIMTHKKGQSIQSIRCAKGYIGTYFLIEQGKEVFLIYVKKGESGIEYFRSIPIDASKKQNSKNICLF